MKKKLILAALVPLYVFAQTKGTPQEKAEYLTQIMEQEIPLEAEQTKEVLAINLEMIENIDQARENGEPFSVLREYSETRDELLMDVLGDDQYKVFESKLALFRQKMNEKFTSD